MTTVSCDYRNASKLHFLLDNIVQASQARPPTASLLIPVTLAMSCAATLQSHWHSLPRRMDGLGTGRLRLRPADQGAWCLLCISTMQSMVRRGQAAVRTVEADEGCIWPAMGLLGGGGISISLWLSSDSAPSTTSSRPGRNARAAIGIVGRGIVTTTC